MNRKILTRIVRKNLNESLSDYIDSPEVEDVINNVKSFYNTAKDKVEKFFNPETTKTEANNAAYLKGNKLASNMAFMSKVNSVANDLGVDPDDLMKVMYKESRLNPQARNPHTNASGLLQFMPSTIQGMKKSNPDLPVHDVSDVVKLPAVQQMDLVKAYFKPYKGKLKSYEDLYAATFYPALLRKGSVHNLNPNAIIGNEKTSHIIAKQNPAISRGKNYITVRDFLNYCKRAN